MTHNSEPAEARHAETMRAAAPRKRVYVAGPISIGDLRENIGMATAAGRVLMRAGFAPLVPALTCYMGGDVPEAFPAGTTHADWLDVDLPWVQVADMLLRLPGASLGADREVAHAKRHGVPVYWSLAELLAGEEQPR